MRATRLESDQLMRERSCRSLSRRMEIRAVPISLPTGPNSATPSLVHGISSELWWIFDCANAQPLTSQGGGSHFYAGGQSVTADTFDHIRMVRSAKRMSICMAIPTSSLNLMEL